MTSTDGLAVDFYRFESAFLGGVATRIAKEVKGAGRVVDDDTLKPLGMIEWE